MDLKVFFKEIVGILTKEKIRYALAGGLVASVYRQEERLTRDLDFLIFSEPNSQHTATHIIRSLGLEPHLIRRADLEGGPLFLIKSKRSEPWIVAGRGDQDPSKIGLDFILPTIPWFQHALERSEHNMIDFGFGKIPCLTVEDVILSKFFSLKNDSSRFNDLDDLKSIFLAHHSLDLGYLAGEMQRLDLTVPPPIRDMAPKALDLVSKKRKRIGASRPRRCKGKSKVP